MRFRVEEAVPGKYVIVPDGSDPLPATFESREAAQQIADKLGQSQPAASEKVPAWDRTGPLATKR